MKAAARGTAALLVRSASRTAALPLGAVGETMRPLPVEALPGTPPFVAGVSVVRGEPVPVVDLDLLLGEARGGTFERFVTVRAPNGRFVLAVREVLGVRELPADAIRDLPPLLGAREASLAAAMVAGDGGLMTLLQTARLVPDQAWQALAARGGAP